MNKLEEYGNLCKRMEKHWDESNEKTPQYFSYDSLHHIEDVANKKSGNSDEYKVKNLKLTNKNRCVEYSVQIDNERIEDCPIYIEF